MAGDDELEEKFPKIVCPRCDPALGARLFLVNRVETPESFWLPESYWRHLQEFHSPPCSRVVAVMEDYLGLRLDLETEERTLLHLAECKGCHEALLREVNICNAEPSRLTFPEG
mgnify:FL=1